MPEYSDYDDQDWEEAVENEEEWRMICNMAIRWSLRSKVYNTDIIITDYRVHGLQSSSHETRQILCIKEVF